MVLAAVLLVIGLIALAGMVSRVNQLGSQTAVEADKAVIDEVLPLQHSLDLTVSTLASRNVTLVSSVTAPLGVTTIRAASGTFADTDVGLRISGTGITVATKIASVTSSEYAVLNRSATMTVGQTYVIYKPGFALRQTTVPTLDGALVSALEQLQSLQAAHGYWLDYTLTCTTPANTNTGLVLLRITDGSVWVELRSSAPFARPAGCPTVTG
jgi:hypothetical protein